MAYSSILVIEDNEEYYGLLRDAFAERDWTCENAVSGRAGIQALDRDDYDVIILDLKLPDMEGIEVLRHAKERKVQSVFIVLTGFGSVDAAVEAMQLGAAHFYEKTGGLLELVAMVGGFMHQGVNATEQLVAGIDRYIRENLRDSDLKLDTIAQKFQITTGYLSMIYRKHMGVNFKKQIQLYRIEESKRWLQDTDEPIYIIAHKCGFKHQTRLTEAFVRSEGMTPKEYRQAHGR